MAVLSLKTAALLAGAAAVAAAQQSVYGQCGGQGYTGATDCVSGSYCQASGDYYSQCVPGSDPNGGSASAPANVDATATGSAPSASSSNKVQYAGVNIAGFDFGMVINGTQDQKQIVDESSDGVNQMRHFVQDGFNMFRLPTGWQYITNNQVGGRLDSNNFGKYDRLVQGCLSLNAYCIVDIHNYARWNNQIIGQGGPSDDQFVALWTSLATKYKSQSRVIFGVMNEPHDININTWAATVQKVVTAIRNAGATTQMILLPGNDFTSASKFISNGSGAALIKITNPDGSTTGLIFDVHKYLDSDNSGTHTECVTNNIDGAFAPLATWLRQNSRQAILSETGGGNTQSCNQYMCQQLAYLNKNTDVYLGWTSWSAGGFQPSWNYELTEVPVNGQDTSLVKTCMVPAAKGTL